ncbi:MULTISPECIES: ABC transporter ATP-binding protein [Halolamina]|uniref:Nickel import system ATP-binding protein NikD n=1 Tax=Halolamina pelagica TaxID=699431 RepID=A0A1I5QVS7_9EURY|nr:MULTISPECIES: ABC transporter ATP-binding protein [Halolamina]NHX35565.1 ABC transporter ATP-binding protein [Halolamina sp. R1-12]SFP50333.1 peptide/nickel transport system ATP-binding protein [Halolamina pelagica]
MTDEPLLSVEGLTTEFDTDNGVLTAVDGIDFEIPRGETVCLVGESGSGKTVASESITRIVPTPPGEVTGSVRFDGQEITSLSESELREIRGGRIAHVFQNPQDALNHCYTVGWQIVEAVQTHEPDTSEEEARERAIELLNDVGVANAAARLDDYPHEFSGGQKQRVMIAMALVTNPDLLIADEPTTALDVTVQAQILNLLEELQEEYSMSILFVTHDLGVVAQIADHVVVMYAGKVMERGTVEEIFDDPSHPYTRALLECLPGQARSAEGIPGTLPSPIDPPDGCRFAPRCDYAVEECTAGDQPPEEPLTDTHAVSCVHYQQGYDPSTVKTEFTQEDGTVTGGVSGD